MRTGSLLTIQVIVFGVVFVLALVTGQILIPILAWLKFGQRVRDDGPATHLKKTGTPTMGGFIFLIPVTLVSIFFIFMDSRLAALLLITLAFGAIGFIDDYIKTRKRKQGLFARQKTALQLLVSASFAVYAGFFTDAGKGIIIPVINKELPLMLFILFTIIFIYFMTNAVNITDGLDGLASGITIIVTVFFIVMAMSRSEWDYIKIFSSMIAGGCLGFLVFNIHPAKVIMGDTGSQALGAAICAISILMRMPLVLLAAGAVYVAEALSVMIQVASFKATGRRVFRMAPLHHHFELSGWKETKVVAVFWSATAVCCILAFIILNVAAGR